MRLRIPRERPVNYQLPRDNAVWPDHRLRTRVTAEIIAWLGADTVCDPAAGDGSILAAAHELRPFTRVVAGDISEPNRAKLAEKDWIGTVVHGAAEDVISASVVDLVVLTEFLEHVPDPVSILRMARQKAKRLVASSPVWSGPTFVDRNEEHLWMFTAQGFEDMLVDAGWRPEVMVPLYFESEYDFQIWVARCES